MSFPSSPRAVVTGAGSGLGRAFCRELARRGAKILAGDVQLAAVQETVSELQGVEAHAVSCDVTQLEQVRHLSEEAKRLFGGVDLVINNAGVAVGGRIGDVPIDSWEWIVNVNLWGVLYGCHVFAPELRQQRGGHILNVASTAGLIASPNLGPYNVTKSAVVALSETLYGELVEAGVGVSVLCPTFFRTNIAASARMHTETPMAGVVERMMAASKLQANDVARIALDRAAAGDFYILPHSDGRLMWRIKRWFPSGFAKLTPKLMALRARRLRQ